MINKFKLFNKKLGNKLTFAGEFKIEEALKALNIDDVQFDKVSKDEKVDYTQLEYKKGIKP